MLSKNSRKFASFALLIVVLLMGAVMVSGQETEITVTHVQGETVVPLNPQTVVVFDLASLSTLAALGVDVAGLPKSNLTGNLAQYASDEYADVGTLFEPDYEAVNALEPDLIIVAARSAAALPMLSEIAPTIDLTAEWDETYFPTQQSNVEILGQIFQKEEEAAALWAELEAKVETLKTYTTDAGTSLIVMTSAGEVTAYGAGSRFAWFHDTLGFTPAIEDIEAATHGEAISFEFILETNPDWLIVVDRDAAIGEAGVAAAQILDNELVAQTTAWANGQVVYVDSSDAYIVMGGLGALTNLVDGFLTAFGVEVAPEATPEATPAS